MLPAEGLRQSGAAVVGAGVQLRAVGDQEVDEVVPAEQGRFLERRESQRLPDVRIRTVLEEELRRIELACEQRGLEWRVQELRLRPHVHLGAPVEEEPRG